MADRLKHWRTHDVELARAAALSTLFIDVLIFIFVSITLFFTTAVTRNVGTLKGRPVQWLLPPIR